jgi:transposase-like protein/transposase
MAQLPPHGVGIRRNAAIVEADVVGHLSRVDQVRSWEHKLSLPLMRRRWPAVTQLRHHQHVHASSLRVVACANSQTGDKYNMRRHIAPEDKAQLVLLFIRSKQSTAALCRKNGISESNYYRWRKIFVLAGTEALRRSPKRAGRTPLRRRTKYEDRASVDAEKMRLLQSVEAVRTQGIDRRARLAETARFTIVDLIDAGSIPKVLAVAVAGVARSTYYGWRKRAQSTSSSHEQGSGHVRLTDRDCVKEAVFKVLHSPPSDHGFNRTTWKVGDLQQTLRKNGLTLGKHAIRTIIKDAGYRWLKARKVLTSRDPDYRTKLDNVQRILGGLTKDDGFFSIDEYGPFAVKRREGRQLVAPGEIATVPQWQRSKGILIMTAALELSTNQVTHFYSEKKNTQEMIKLLEILLERNRHLSRIYLSWDAASWHISKRLSEQITSNNVMAHVTGSTRVEVAPLPAGAQFLNVIESVFSGMARAIIHHSDYQSKDDAKAAIDRYFCERNEHFRMNPQRAGKRIWGREYQLATFSEANNCKDPTYR